MHLISSCFNVFHNLYYVIMYVELELVGCLKCQHQLVYSVYCYRCELFKKISKSVSEVIGH